MEVVWNVTGAFCANSTGENIDKSEHFKTMSDLEQRVFL